MSKKLTLLKKYGIFGQILHHNGWCLERGKMRYSFVVFVSALLLLSGCAGNIAEKRELNSFDKTSLLLENAANTGDIAKLNLFISNMPKGGDLHHHYSGSIYAETYLEWLKRKNWRIDPKTLTIVKPKLKASGKKKSVKNPLYAKALTTEQLMGNQLLYRKLLSLWSTKDFYNHSGIKIPPDAHFFRTFYYFGAVDNAFVAEGLKQIKERAVAENVLYIESMLKSVGIKSDKYYSDEEKDKLISEMRAAKNQAELDKILDKVSSKYLANKQFNQAIEDYMKWVAGLHKAIDSDKFTMRYQSYAVRVMDPLRVFSDLLAAYLVVNKSPLMVGVNILAPEHNNTSLRDYTLHMRMYNYLLRKYPEVNRSLHAGELTVGMVRPEDLTFHIKEAVEIAKAQRIGHGIDLPYETGSLELLKKMKENRTAVEINLTSNEFILGIKGKAHPYMIYSAYGVPMVISTDDAGVSRGSLTKEYVLLTSRYKTSYKKIKEYVYNSIDYSFLKDEMKKKLKNSLNERFEIFENKMGRLYETFKKQ